MEWRERFQDELSSDCERDPTCAECVWCDMPEKGFCNDPRIAKCSDSDEWIHADWECGDCESFFPR